MPGSAKDKGRAGRPRGEIARALLAEIREHGPITTRELAARLQLTLNAAKFTCSRLLAAGEIEVADTVPQSWSNRPASRYVISQIAQSNVAQSRHLGQMWRREA